jgi:hypothetical protein
LFPLVLHTLSSDAASTPAPEPGSSTTAKVDHGRPGSIVLKTEPVIEPVRSSVQVFTGRTTGLSVHCLVFKIYINIFLLIINAINR